MIKCTFLFFGIDTECFQLHFTSNSFYLKLYNSVNLTTPGIKTKKFKIHVINNIDFFSKFSLTKNENSVARSNTLI